MSNSAQNILPVYNRSSIEISHGEGAYLYATNGREYLDFVSGIATNCLGHCHPRLVNALKTQADKLWHISNLYQIPGMKEFASDLTKNSFADTVFFGNSGAEAIECLIKMVRKYHDATGNPNKYRLITFTGAFHGRTLAALWASKRDPLIQDGFGPPVEGFDPVEFGNIEAVKNAIGPDTAGILVEVVQGDGGVRVATLDFILAFCKFCDENNLLLCIDEIQSGMGRTGKLFAHEHYGITPDIMTSAKGIGGGFPLGACLATKKAASGMTLGTHGSTYGGNPLAMKVGHEVFNIVNQKDFLANVKNNGEYFKAQLEIIKNNYPEIVKEIRGLGFLLGIQLTSDNKIMAKKLEEHGLLVASASENVIRLLPPLIVTKEQIDQALTIISATFKEIKNG